MHANLLAESDHYSGEGLRATGPIGLTIKGITREEMEHIDAAKRGKMQNKGVISFVEAGSKTWIINKTNKELMVAVFGGGRCGKSPARPDDHKDGKCFDTDHWIGHRIAIGPTDQKVGGKGVDGIIVTGCDVLTAPLTVEVKHRSKAPRNYTVHPPRAKAATRAAETPTTATPATPAGDA